MKVVNLLRKTKKCPGPVQSVPVQLQSFLTFFVNTTSSLKISYNKSLPQNRDTSLLDGTFPEDLKTAEFVPVYKKRNALTKIITDL